uniref:Protein kinase domain-containing protein n=1 Tax=Brassica oleracea var. oleracea TaxID=109376 RepID=A0A0D3DKP2_BRAOL
MDISCCGDYSDASPVAEMATESEWFALRLLCVVFFFFSSVLLLCYFLYPKLPKAAAGDEESGEPLPPAMILGKIGGGGITTDVCVICLEEFRRNDAVRVLVTCRHVFHVQCIDSWCLYKLACPVCRAPFRTQITTTLNVTDSSNGYAPPRDAITTAAIPTNASEPLTIIWSLETSDDETYGYLYFAEIQQLRANETREFKIVANGRVDYDSYSPMNFEADTVFNHVSLKCEGAVCRLQLLRTPKSTLPPQMNAMEIFSAIYFPQSETSTDDGGFGVVCHGYLNNEHVAVKVLSQSSTQGYNEFKTEVELLLRVHHVNLVSLIGYCDEGNDLALIYEYMGNGNLKEHLSGKRRGSVLNWSNRLKIATEFALGIEYLHIGCKSPMVHRDVKTTNILLGETFEAKLADFGLSRSFLVGGNTHVSTNVAGTIGYLDPEYYQKNWLTEESDVYSFGIVLLEIITGQPVIEQSRYDKSSPWKALELAMSCINPSSTERPNMTRVAHELNECLEIYENLSKRSQDANSTNSMGHGTSFISDTPSAR